jgi:hypothetical protein
MKEIFNILRKDVRQHWPVILLTLSASAASAWDEPRHWVPWTDFGLDRTRWIPILLILSWWVLVIRLVQSEALAGDRQYWITRPIEWKRLLAAKILYIAIFVNAPALLVEVYLLRKAGFRLSIGYLPGLFSVQMDIAVILLAGAALAAVTPNFGQMMIAILAVGIFATGMAIVDGYLPPSGSFEIPDNLSLGITVAACCTATGWQYARRKTKQSRMMLVAAAVALFIIEVGTPFLFPLSFRYTPAPRGARPPLQMSLEAVKPDPTPSDSEIKRTLGNKEKDVEINLPLDVSGIAEDSVVQVDGVRATISGLDRQWWDSGWFHEYSTLLPDAKHRTISFRVKKAFFVDTLYTPVTIHLAFALAELRDSNPTKVFSISGYFPVPGLGLCRDSTTGGAIFCRYALQGPSLAVVTTSSSESTCSPMEGESLPPGRTARGWGSNTDTGPFSPIGTVSLSLGQWDGEAGEGPDASICPGTPFQVSFPKGARHVQLDLQLEGIRLTDYQGRQISEYGYQFKRTR